MLSAFSRLRLWVGLSALLMIGVVAGFYIYARYRVQRAVRDLPGKLGVNIQQNTNGFTYSQSAGGHTIFSITASNAVRYKQGGKAELHNVKIISYGRDSDRFDEITGDDFEYDAQSGDVVAKGKASIQLQATTPGTSGPGSDPKRIGSVVQLETEGLTFNKNSGVAHTEGKINFGLPQGAGSAVGATYDSKKNTLALHSDLHLVTSGPKPMNMQAASAVFLQQSRELTLVNFHSTSGIRRMDAQHVVLRLREDNTVERANASGGVNTYIRGPRTAEVHASSASFAFAQNNEVRDGRLNGGITWQTDGQSVSRGNAGEVLLAFTPGNQIKRVQLRENVDLLQPPADPNVGQGTEFRGDGLDLDLADGNLQKANSMGSAQILLSSPQATEKPPTTASRTAGQTVITSSRFDARFTADNRLANLTGAAPVKIVSSTPNKPDRVSQSRDLLVTFTNAKTPAIDELVQTGDVQIKEAQRNATADRATYSQSSDTMTLTGNVHYKDESTGSALTSNSLVLSRANGQTTASGEVKTTYSEQKGQQAGAMLSPTLPVHVTAPQMVANSSNGAARYTGGARLWQGGNILQAPTLDFNRKDRTLSAQSEGSNRVSTVFVQADKNGKQAPVEITSDQLRYDDSSRKAVFDGSILLRSADSTLHADKATVTLRPQPDRTQAPKTAKTVNSNAPNQVQTIDATGAILLQQPGRRATGTRLVYTADEEKFVLTGTPGNPPSIFDAEHGQVTGVSLTFFNRDDRVLVDSSNSMSITQSQLKK